MELNPYDTIYKGDFVDGGSEEFWKAKYEKDFGEFRINRRLQTYKERYWQIALILKPSNWFGYYSDDEANLDAILIKASYLSSAFFAVDLSPKMIPYSVDEKQFIDIIINNVNVGAMRLDLRGANKSYIEFLMEEGNENTALELLKRLGLDRLTLSIDTLYELLFYILTGPIKKDMVLNGHELSTLSSLNLEKLNEIDNINNLSVGSYNETRVQEGMNLCSQFRTCVPSDFRVNNHALIIIHAMYGKLPETLPPIPSSKRLAYIAQFSPYKVYLLAHEYLREQYRREGREIGMLERLHVPYPYYTYVALQVPNEYLERSLLSLNENNFRDIIGNYEWDDGAPVISFKDSLRRFVYEGDR